MLQPSEISSKMDKVCGVCGDRAKSFHFGGLSCDSCKAFFRRSVQKDAYKGFKCSYEGQCVITLSTRKSCQFCRLQRCFRIGMEKSWVMTEQERLEMMKARAEKKLRHEHEQQQLRKEEEKAKQIKQTDQAAYEPDVATIGDYLSADELREIEGTILKYMQAYQQVPYSDILKHYNNDRPGVQVINMFTTLIRRFAFFSRLLPQFASLIHRDQAVLLRGGILEMCLLRGALTFDPSNNRWPDTSFALYHDAPVLRIDDARKLVSSKLFDMHMDFIACVQRMNVDEPTIMLLLLVVLFTPERPGLSQIDLVTKHQEHFSNLLRRYMTWRFGKAHSTGLFSKLLTKISDLRELSDSHTRYNLRLDKQAVDEIQQQLGNMNLNPYPEWNIVNIPNPPGAQQSSTERPQEPPWQTNNGFEGYRQYEGYADTDSAALSTIPQTDVNFGWEFMQAMQKSLTQILTTPHFGFEWVTPAMELGPFPGYNPQAALGDDIFRELSAPDRSTDSVEAQQPRPESICCNGTCVSSAVETIQENLSEQQLEEFREVLDELLDNEHMNSILKTETLCSEGFPARTSQNPSEESVDFPHHI